MKKIITVIVLCLALASCAKENSGGIEPSTQDVSTSAAQETEVLSDFETETEQKLRSSQRQRLMLRRRPPTLKNRR